MERYIYRGQSDPNQMTQMLQRCVTCLSVTQALSWKSRTNSNWGALVCYALSLRCPQRFMSWVLLMTLWHYFEGCREFRTDFEILWNSGLAVVNTLCLLPDEESSESALGTINQAAPPHYALLHMKAETVKQNAPVFSWVVLLVFCHIDAIRALFKL